MAGATRLRVEYRWYVNEQLHAADGVLSIERALGRKAGVLAHRTFAGEFTFGPNRPGPRPPPGGTEAKWTAPAGAGSVLNGIGTISADLLAMTSPVKCTVGARGSGKNELDLLPELLGTRFFSVRTTDVTLLDPSGGEARPAGTLSHSEAVHVVGSTFRVRQVVVGDLDLGAHVASIGTIREEGWRWREGGVFTTGYFPAGLEGGRQADVRFTQIYERTETVRKPRRGHGKRRRHKPLPHHWWLQVDVTRFAPGPHKVEYETVSRLSFRPPR